MHKHKHWHQSPTGPGQVVVELEQNEDGKQPKKVCRRVASFIYVACQEHQIYCSFIMCNKLINEDLI
jgi:hypothetical protein